MINLDITFVFQLVNFLLLMALLNQFLFKPVRKVLTERAAEIAGAKEKSAAVDAEVQEQLAQYESRLRQIRTSAADERGALRKQALGEEAAILDQAKAQASQKVAAIKERVAKEAAEARALLKGNAETLSAEICEKVLGRSL